MQSYVFIVIKAIIFYVHYYHRPINISFMCITTPLMSANVSTCMGHVLGITVCTACVPSMLSNRKWKKTWCRPCSSPCTEELSTLWWLQMSKWKCEWHIGSTQRLLYFYSVTENTLIKPWNKICFTPTNSCLVMYIVFSWTMKMITYNLLLCCSFLLLYLG